MKEGNEVIARLCAEFGIDVNFYTMEANENLLQVEFGTDDGMILWHLGRTVVREIDLQEAKPKL